MRGWEDVSLVRAQVEMGWGLGEKAREEGETAWRAAEMGWAGVAARATVAAGWMVVARAGAAVMLGWEKVGSGWVVREKGWMAGAEEVAGMGWA